MEFAGCIGGGRCRVSLVAASYQPRKVVVRAKRWRQCPIAVVLGCVKRILAQSSYFTAADDDPRLTSLTSTSPTINCVLLVLVSPLLLLLLLYYYYFIFDIFLRIYGCRGILPPVAGILVWILKKKKNLKSGEKSTALLCFYLNSCRCEAIRAERSTQLEH